VNDIDHPTDMNLERSIPSPSFRLIQNRGMGAVRTLAATARPLRHRQAAAAPTNVNGSELVRDYLHRVLYERDRGYFNRAHRVGAPPPASSDGTRLPGEVEWLPKLAGELDYKQRVQSMYEGLKTGWMTPCELFQPYYSRVLARWIVDELKERQTTLRKDGWELMEIGGGQGTNAVHILDELCAHFPDQYESLRAYSLVDVSEKLSADQRTKIELHRHQHKCRIVNASAVDLPPPLVADDLCIVLGLEVLDNMVHDRVVNWSSDSPMETLIDPLNRLETLRPIEDSLIKRCIEVQRRTPLFRPSFEERFLSSVQNIFSWFERGRDAVEQETNAIWLPTTCLAFLDRVEKVLPNHTVLLADFDALPSAIDGSIRAPVVAQQHDGFTIDSNTYRVPVGSADVFFPTDFGLLSALYTEAVKGASHSAKSREFMQRYASQEIIAATTTQDGYNPLIEDYVNTSIFIGRRCSK
jgi:hypothetical protein